MFYVRFCFITSRTSLTHFKPIERVERDEKFPNQIKNANAFLLKIRKKKKKTECINNLCNDTNMRRTKCKRT